MVIKQPPKYRYVIGFNPETCQPTSDMLGVMVKCTEAELLNGDSKGEMVSELKLNQIAKIKSNVGPRKFNALVGYNPELAEYGDVSLNPMLEGGEQLELIIKVRKPMTLTDLSYIFKMWVIE